MEELPDDVLMEIMKWSQIPRLISICHRFHQLETRQEVVNWRVKSMNSKYGAYTGPVDDTTIDAIMSRGKGDDILYCIRYARPSMNWTSPKVYRRIAYWGSRHGLLNVLRWMLRLEVDNYEELMSTAITYERGDIVLQLLQWYPCMTTIHPDLPEIVRNAQHQYNMLLEERRHRNTYNRYTRL